MVVPSGEVEVESAAIDHGGRFFKAGLVYLLKSALVSVDAAVCSACLSLLSLMSEDTTVHWLPSKYSFNIREPLRELHHGRVG
jgi:hypothetical protein